MNTYNKVKKLLQDNPELRNSDKKLIWTFTGGFTDYNVFMNSVPFESITRARRAVQKSHPELQATKQVQEARTEKANDPNGWLF